MVRWRAVRMPFCTNIEFAKSFAKDNSGAIAITFAIASVALFGMIGISMDYARSVAVRNQLQSAADAAVLAAKRFGDDPIASAKLKAEETFAANNKDTHTAILRNVEVVVTDEGATVTAIADVPATVARILGVESLEVSAVSRSVTATTDLEVALVLDNTGSMRNDMIALKDAAKDLTNALFDNAGSLAKLKLAVVPYVGAVNIGNDTQQMAWMDTSAGNQHHGDHFRYHWFASDPNCVPAPSNGGGSDDPGPGTGGSDRQASNAGHDNTWFAWAAHVLGVTSAHAQVPAGFSVDDCALANPGSVNHFDLFSRIANASWKGCVEARPEPYDVDDTPRSNVDPDTRFVPYFWPDEPDVSSSGGVTYPNNYMSDKENLLPSPYVYQAPGYSSSWDSGRFRSIVKYDNSNATIIDETAPETFGPNASCPDEVLPLTDDRATIISKIDSLSHWDGSGTVSSEGLAWGWRILSPGEPFTEGAAYGEGEKVIVLMTDGRNMAAEQAGYATYSDYTAYGTVKNARKSELSTYAGYQTHLNNRLLAACANAKAADVEIYTVTFGAIDPETENIYKQCATRPPMHYAASSSEELIGAFRDIAMGLSQLRLSQ